MLFCHCLSWSHSLQIYQVVSITQGKKKGKKEFLEESTLIELCVIITSVIVSAASVIIAIPAPIAIHIPAWAVTIPIPIPIPIPVPV
jgi:hypothetical protein